MSREKPQETADVKFGANLRTLRERNGISQAELAQAMTERGWPWYQSTVARVESGRQSVRFPEAFALAELMKTSLDRFTWGSAEANETEFVYAARARLVRAHETAVDAIVHLLAEVVIADRMAERHKGSEYKRVQDAVDDLNAALETCGLEQAIEDGIRRYEDRVAEQARMEREVGDDGTDEDGHTGEEG